MLHAVAALMLWTGAAAPARVSPPPSGQEAAVSASPTTPGLPPGGVTDWIDDMVRGLEVLSSLPPDSASRHVLGLYVGRQEYLELMYGRGGVVTGDGFEALDGEIRRAETSFHEILASTGAGQWDREFVQEEARRAIQALRAARKSILDLGLPLRPRAESVQSAYDARSQDHRAATQDYPEARSPAVRDLITSLDRAAASYRTGDVETSLTQVEQAYLEQFEAMEARIPGHLATRTERLIHLSLRPSLQGGAPQQEVDRVFDDLRTQLLEIDRILDQPMPATAAFVQSFLIILREGLEAALLLAVLSAGLARLDAPRRLRSAVGVGAAAALGLTVLAWVIADVVLGRWGGQRELVEGGVSLVAAGLLVLVSNWLFRRTYLDDWRTFLQSRLAGAARTGSFVAVASLSFAAVFREGLETALFIEALTLGSDPSPVVLGVLAGLGLVVLLALGIMRLGHRLPIRELFAWTNIALVGLAAVLVGKGVFSLGEAGVYTPTPLPWLDLPPALGQAFGIFPTAETLGTQLVLGVLVLSTFLLAKRRRAVSVRGAGALDQSHNDNVHPQRAA